MADGWLAGSGENVLKWKWNRKKKQLNDIIIDGVASLVNAYIINEWKSYILSITVLFEKGNMYLSPFTIYLYRILYTIH